MALTTKPTLVVPNGNYEPGDIVWLVSGGPDMTVIDVCPDCGEVEVAWFSDGGDGFNVEQFPAICLELAS